MGDLMIGNNHQELDDLYQEKQYEEYIGVYKKLPLQTLNLKEAYFWKYLWSAYHVHYAKKDCFSDSNIEKSMQFLDYVLKKASNQDLIVIISVFKFVDFLLDQSQPDYQKALDFINKLDYETLSTEEKTIETTDGSRTFASNKEKFLTTKAKCLFELERYHETIDFIEIAIKDIESFHNNNDVWLRKRLSESYLKIKNYEKALENIDLAIVKKREWFLLKIKGDIFYNKGDYRTANDIYIKALKLSGSDEMKIKIYTYFQQLTFNEKVEISQSIKDFLIALKSANGWSLNKDESILANQYPKKYKKEEINKIKKGFFPTLIQLYEIPAVRYTGFIDLISIDKGYGFISSEISSKIYINLKKISIDFRETLHSKDAVSFELVKSFDHKRKIESLEAINLKKV